MKAEYLYISLNIAGLILDLTGFVKIYLANKNPLQKIKESNFEYKATKHRQSPINLVIKELNNKIVEINNQNELIRNINAPYFRLIIYGVSLQIISTALLIYGESIQP